MLSVHSGCLPTPLHFIREGHEGHVPCWILHGCRVANDGAWSRREGGGREREGQKDEGAKERERKRWEALQVRWRLLPRLRHYMPSMGWQEGDHTPPRHDDEPSLGWAGAQRGPALAGWPGRPRGPSPWQDEALRQKSQPRTPGEQTRKRLRSRPPPWLGNKGALGPSARTDPDAEQSCSRACPGASRPSLCSRLKRQFLFFFKNKSERCKCLQRLIRAAQ